CTLPPADPLRRPSPLSDDRELLRGWREDLTAVGGDNYEVFDPHAESPRHVDARLDRHRVARDQLSLRSNREGRLLVDLEANPVAEPVAELIPVAAVGDDASRDAIELPPTDACPRLRQRGALGLLNEAVDGGGLLVDGSGRVR